MVFFDANFESMSDNPNQFHRPYGIVEATELHCTSYKKEICLGQSNVSDLEDSLQLKFFHEKRKKIQIYSAVSRQADFRLLYVLCRS